MTTTKKFVDYTRWLITLFLVAGLLIATGSAFAEESKDGTRLSISSQSTRAERDSGMAASITEDEFAALRDRSQDATSTRKSSPSKLSAVSAQSTNADFWFYSADVELFMDRDRDGYYHGIDLLFDADSYFAIADVYAVVYLSFEGGPWNEYAATENFTLFGATSDDDYVIVTELVSGYPTGSYDLLIELFDAYDDTFLAYFGPEDTSELSFLPLEDADRDIEIVPDIIVVENHHGGGSFGLIFILAIGLAAWTRHRGQRASISA